MERKILTRREFLQVALLTAAGLPLVECKPFRASIISGEFVYRQDDPLGIIEIHLPDGESHPEKGGFIHNIKLGALEKIGISGSQILRPRPLRASVLYTKGPQVLQIQFVISKFEDKEPKDKLSIDIVDDSDSQETHQFAVSWSNWKITDATWDGMTIPKPPTA